MKYLDEIVAIDCIEGMKQLPSESIDFIITSPPYDNVRKYNGFSYDLHKTGEESFRLLKPGSVAVMVIQDQTVDYGKTLTSFKTIVDWCENLGFKLFETIIYRKNGTEGAWWKSRFRIDHEYIPIFLKGEKPIYFEKEHLKVKSKHGGKIMSGFASRKTDGTTQESVRKAINPLKCRGTIWYYDSNGEKSSLEDYISLTIDEFEKMKYKMEGGNVLAMDDLKRLEENLRNLENYFADRGTIWNYLMAGDKDPLKRKHPAHFPDKIPMDFIPTFCPPEGIVLDPFVGSGTSAFAAQKLGRHYIGFDISEEYCKIARERIKGLQPTLI